MSEKSELNAAVAAGVVGSEEAFRALLGAIVEVARSIFGARASSILLFDEETEELVFEAVVGEGEESLLGMRFPAGKGIAGWVLATRTPLVIEDVRQDPRFASDVAEDTGYVPSGLMAAPLLHDEEALGVLEVLDRPGQSLFSLQEMELLGLFANQASIAVDLLLRSAEGRAGAGGRRRRPRGRRAARGDRGRARGRAPRGGDYGSWPTSPTRWAPSEGSRTKRGPGGCTSRPGLDVRASSYEAVGPDAVGPDAVGPDAVGPDATGPWASTSSSSSSFLLAVGPLAVGPLAVGPLAVGP